MKIKTLLSVLGMLLPLLSVKAQQIKPLNIGDTVPDITLHNVINYKDSVIRLSDFSGKGIILDFFSTWCGSCIAALSKLEGMQSHYGDSLQIVVVCNESRERIEQFIHTKPAGLYRHLPFATGDSCLNLVFPHRILPHEVILYGKRVVSITELDYLTQANLHGLVTLGQMDAPLKKDRTVRNMDSVFGSGANHYSIDLRPYADGYASGFSQQYDTLHKAHVYTFTNRPLLAILSWSLGRDPKGLFVDVPLQSLLIRGSLPLFPWILTHGYCVRIAVPDSAGESTAKALLQSLLCSRFNITCREGNLYRSRPVEGHNTSSY